ncbi:uncharacterized protein LOC116293685 [Actinia tenebrosa]|uniref:Uncharacterized protein LOC116293685 n=1 Tax=Actinia tenebrosa TaxID=6105 RepID=A0A6P8HPL3_ACTTE|nr:uncharacterized protein LOC116293685 [Actinia tenebrosa]
MADGVIQSGETKTNKHPYKKCSLCEEKNGNAAKKCKKCKNDFNIISTHDWEALQRKGKTCPTDQRKKMQMRANILHSQHDWEIIILGYKRHSRGTSFYTYGTPGLGEQFIGNDKAGGRSEDGKDGHKNVYCIHERTKARQHQKQRWAKEKYNQQ